MIVAHRCKTYNCSYPKRPFKKNMVFHLLLSCPGCCSSSRGPICKGHKEKNSCHYQDKETHTSAVPLVPSCTLSHLSLPPILWESQNQVCNENLRNNHQWLSFWELTIWSWLHTQTFSYQNVSFTMVSSLAIFSCTRGIREAPSVSLWHWAGDLHKLTSLSHETSHPEKLGEEVTFLGCHPEKKTYKTTMTIISMAHNLKGCHAVSLWCASYTKCFLWIESAQWTWV